RKARLVIDLIRGKDVEEAAAILKFTPNEAATAIGKVLNSAVANAVNNNDLDEEKLYVKACYANEGVTLKRFMPRAKGNASAIHKRTSHITIVVAERN
ncbi:MAG: 50S ribosomal protein L22, partial [Vagococcus sp.]